MSSSFNPGYSRPLYRISPSELVTAISILAQKLVDSPHKGTLKFRLLKIPENYKQRLFLIVPQEIKLLLAPVKVSIW